MNQDFNTLRYSDEFRIEPVRTGIVLDWIGTGQRVLDIGCGDGCFAELIRRHDNTVSGIEHAAGAVRRARAKGITVHEADLNTDWQQGITERFDVVWAGEIIEHVFDTDRFLRNIHTVLRDNGRLVLTTPNVASLGRRLLLLVGHNPLLETTARTTDAGHIRYFTFPTLARLLNENSFAVLRHTSDVVNFDAAGRLASRTLARLVPALGRSLIVEARKLPGGPR